MLVWKNERARAKAARQMVARSLPPELQAEWVEVRGELPRLVKLVRRARRRARANMARLARAVSLV